MSGGAILEIEGLSAAYGQAQILFDVSLALAQGEIVALMGRNGAGKSTTLKALMGLIPALSGEILFDRKNLQHLHPYEIARLGLGYVPEDRRIFGELTVAENLEVGRRPIRPGFPEWSPQKLFALFPNLAGMSERPGARMSGGEQKMLSIARTLMGNPATLLLDEPSEGLAPVLAARMVDTIRDLKEEGMSVLLCEQNLGFARRVADRAYLIERGQISEHPLPR